MESQQNQTKDAVFLLLMLYLRDTTILYIPQFEPLMHVAHWLDLISEDELDRGGETYKLKQKGITIPIDLGYDICASCLDVKGHTDGGRVRSRCSKCYTWKFADKFFHDPWHNRIAQLTGYSPEYLEFMLAEALHMYKTIREKQHTSETLQYG